MTASLPFTRPLFAAALILAGSNCYAQELFSDQTQAQGVSFAHHVNPTDPLKMGAGGAWGDFDGDGWVDLYVADRSGPNELFHNVGNSLGFVAVAAEFGVDDPDGESTGALWGDYDNDGDKDLYVLNRGDNVMFRNDGPDGEGGWVFVDVTSTIGAAAFGRTAAAVYGDYDNDGWLDLYVANHEYAYDFPEPGPDANRADYLLHNVDGGSGVRVFEDVASSLLDPVVLQYSLAHSAGFLDYDNDGDVDLYIVNEVMNQHNSSLKGCMLWRNDGGTGDGDWIFTDVSLAANVNLQTQAMGVAIGDYNNDGWLDFAITDLGPNRLYVNLGAVYLEVGEEAGIDRPVVPGTSAKQVGWGLVFSDYDCDAYEDLYVATGKLGGQGDQPNPLFRNDGNPLFNSFTDVTDASGCDAPTRSRTVVKADYDRDGDEDYYVVAYDDDGILYRNDACPQNHLIVELIGTRSNRDAIGARIVLCAAGLPDQHRMVQSGSTTGGGNDLPVHFGMAAREIADSLTIHWPSGARTMLTDLAANGRYALTESPLLGDSDGDTDVDLLDFAHLQFCFGRSPGEFSDCRVADLDANGAIDANDLMLFQSGFTGPG